MLFGAFHRAVCPQCRRLGSVAARWISRPVAQIRRPRPGRICLAALSSDSDSATGRRLGQCRRAPAPICRRPAARRISRGPAQSPRSGVQVLLQLQLIISKESSNNQSSQVGSSK